MAPSRVPPSVLAALGLISMEAACLPDACAPERAPAADSDTPVQPPTMCLSPVEVAPCLSDRPELEEPERREPNVGPCLKPLMDPHPYNDNVPKPPPRFLPGKEPEQPAACLSEVPPEVTEPRSGLHIPAEPPEDGPPVNTCLSSPPGHEEARLQLPPGEEARAAVLERGVLPADVASMLRGGQRG